MSTCRGHIPLPQAAATKRKPRRYSTYQRNDTHVAKPFKKMRTMPAFPSVGGNNLATDKTTATLQVGSACRTRQSNDTEKALDAVQDYRTTDVDVHDNENIGEEEDATQSDEDCIYVTPTAPEPLTEQESADLNHGVSDALQQTGLVEIDADVDNTDKTAEYEDDEVAFDEVVVERLCNLPVPVILRQMRRGIRYVTSWERMVAYLSLHGRITFTVTQYNVLSSVVDTASANNLQLSHYNRVKDAQARFIRSNCFPRNELYYVPSRRAAARRMTQATVKTTDGMDHDVRDCLRLVLPSEWAKLDIITYPIFEQLYSRKCLLQDMDAMTIEKSVITLPLIRRTAFGGRLSIWVQHKNGMVPSSLNQAIRFRCLTAVSKSLLNEELRSCWAMDEYQQSRCPSQAIFVSGRAGPIWCVGGRSGDRKTSASNCRNLPAQENIIFERLSIATHTFEDIGYGMAGGRRRANTNQSDTNLSVSVYPADVCAIIRPFKDSSNCVCVMIGSFIARGDTNPAERLVWINPDSMKTVAELVVSDSPVLLEDCSIFSARLHDQEVRNQGKLGDGRPYYIYRFLVYQDGFKQKKSLSDKRSVLGCYLLPVGLNQDYRKSWAAARIITLGAHGQSANEVMNITLEDLANGAAYGVDCVNSLGERCVVFLDPVGLIADYPALAALTDAMGHSADVFCSFCAIPKSKGSAAAVIVYTSKLHSRRLSLMRFDARMDVVRNEGVMSEQLRKHIGVKSNTKEKAAAYFTERLSLELCRRRLDMPKNSTGQLANPCHFDSFLSAPAAPDHLLSGLTKDVLRVCFNVLATDAIRKRVDDVICDHISTTNLPRIDSVLHWSSQGVSERKKGIIQLNSLTMSSLFCVLLFASEVFQMSTYTAATTENVSPFRLSRLLQDVVCFVYWLPLRTSSTLADFNYVRHSQDYYGELMNRARKYIDESAQYIRDGGRHAKLLDKPNGHRLLELCAHTIPIYRHASNVSELVLECVHQNFKGWLEKNPNHNGHITAVEMALAKDWAARLYALSVYWKSGTSKEKEAAERGLIRLCLGEAAAILCCSSSDSKLLKVQTEFRKCLETLFQDPVPMMLKGTATHPMIPMDQKRWIAYEILTQSRICNDLLEGGRLVHQLYNEVSTQRALTLQYFATAKYVISDKYTGNRRMYSHNKLTNGSVFSIVTNLSECNMVAAAHSSESSINYFCVVGFVSMGEKSLWAAARRMEKYQTGFYRISNRLQMVRLCDSVRSVAAVHNCDDRCGIIGGHFKHSSSIFEDGDWILIGKRAGFPPHMG